MADPTPIPAEALEAAAKVALRRYESEYSVAPNVTWRDFVAEVQEMVEAVAPILLAAGRTAAAEDPLAEEVARAAVAWRTALVTEGEDIGEVEGALFHLADRYENERAARVAENGADRLPAQRTAQVAIDCGGCGDTIWPTEHVYEVGDGRVRCVICQVKSSGKRAGADR